MYASRFGTRIAAGIFEIYGWKYRRVVRKARQWISRRQLTPQPSKDARQSPPQSR
jgi:hypothetical protein